MAVVSKSNFLKEQQGFTLIELLIVIFTLGLLTSLAFPNAADIINRHRLESATKEIASDLRLAQQMAISKEKNFRVIMNDSRSNPQNTYFILEVNGQTLKTVQLPANIIFSTSHYFDFSSSGQTPNRTIRLVNKNSNQAKYIVIYRTGRIRISDKLPSSGDGYE
ncbi:MAG: pilus assembly FimT family protein [Peptococcales bacterium]|jgi:prepilin-type N-terminal cleavage/methylation domain-containing protein